VAQLDDRELATQLFNRCWELLEATRDADDDIELLTVAFSSRYHWLNAGDREQWIVSDWMVARAAAAVGEGELSLRFAKRAHSAAQEYEVPDWLVRQARKASLGRSRHWVTSKNSTTGRRSPLASSRSSPIPRTRASSRVNWPTSKPRRSALSVVG